VGRDLRGVLDALERYARAHRGTKAGAKALFDLGQLRLERHPDVDFGGDPTERFLRVLAIVHELEGGGYPAGEGGEQAPSLVIRLYQGGIDTTIPSAHIGRMLKEYERFVVHHWSLDAIDPTADGIGWVITGQMARLYKLQGDEAGGLERLLARLE